MRSAKKMAADLFDLYEWLGDERDRHRAKAANEGDAVNKIVSLVSADIIDGVMREIKRTFPEEVGA
jgi:pheromone shutdown protein TraB